MSDFAIQELYKKWIELDRELKQLRAEVNQIKGLQYFTKCSILKDTNVGYSGNTKPAQWPNEPYTDYLKRIGEYNEAMIYEDDSK